MDRAVPLRERGVEVRMEFGGTEIAVSCYKQHDGDKLLDAKVSRHIGEDALFSLRSSHGLRHTSNPRPPKGNDLHTSTW